MKRICLIFTLLLSSGCYYDDSVRIYRNSTGKEMYSVECKNYYGYMYDCVASASEYCNGDYTIVGSKKVKRDATKSDDNYETEVLSYYEGTNWLDENAPQHILNFYCNDNFFDNF